MVDDPFRHRDTRIEETAETARPVITSGSVLGHLFPSTSEHLSNADKYGTGAGNTSDIDALVGGIDHRKRTQMGTGSHRGLNDLFYKGKEKPRFQIIQYNPLETNIVTLQDPRGRRSQSGGSAV